MSVILIKDKVATQKALYNCWTDLQRAAMSFYLNPSGKNHLVFLDHGQKILSDLKANSFLRKLSDIKEKITTSTFAPVKIADEILTLGILIKNKAYIYEV